jgi:hypothetical protein
MPIAYFICIYDIIYIYVYTHTHTHTCLRECTMLQIICGEIGGRGVGRVTSAPGGGLASAILGEASHWSAKCWCLSLCRRVVVGGGRSA